MVYTGVCGLCNNNTIMYVVMYGNIADASIKLHTIILNNI